MKLLITGICGFVGSSLAESLLQRHESLEIVGIDNLFRPGSEMNRARLQSLGVKFTHGDVRCASDLESLPEVDWVIDAAANPTVLAGLNKGFSSRQLFEHNLWSVVNLLEYCKAHRSGFILISTSRVYSVEALCAVPLRVDEKSFALDTSKNLPVGVSACGLGVDFPTSAPISLYGSSKLAAEAIALEYAIAFDFPVWIDRCGVLAGAGQFGTPDQGIFSFWINAHLRRRRLRYIGFGGTGKQRRDLFHPRDLSTLLDTQIRTARRAGQRIYNAGGGQKNSISLAELNCWCDGRFIPNQPEADPQDRPYDTPWLVMDASDAERDFNWQITTSLTGILDELAYHAEANPDWLERSGYGNSATA